MKVKKMNFETDEDKILRLEKENLILNDKILELDNKIKKLKSNENVVGYFGSPYNKCFPLLRRNMSVINIDLAIGDNAEYLLRFVECKPMGTKFDINNPRDENTGKMSGQKRILRTIAKIFKAVMKTPPLYWEKWKLYQYILWYEPNEIPNPEHIKVHNLVTGKLFDLYGQDNIIKWNEGHLDESKIESKDVPII